MLLLLVVLVLVLLLVLGLGCGFGCCGVVIVVAANVVAVIAAMTTMITTGRRGAMKKIMTIPTCKRNEQSSYPVQKAGSRMLAMAKTILSSTRPNWAAGLLAFCYLKSGGGSTTHVNRCF